MGDSVDLSCDSELLITPFPYWIIFRKSSNHWFDWI